MKKTIFTTILTVSFMSVLFLTGCGQKNPEPNETSFFDAVY
ncbi:MAG: lipoprotein [Planctomycetaceae bacterium]|jgi:predicted small lipoprotein YifL|nr:lipoprotein [Planctomycetaceae bacterium]